MAKLLKPLFTKFPSWKISRYGSKNPEMFQTNGRRKWRNGFKTKKSVVLAAYLEQEIDYS